MPDRTGTLLRAYTVGDGLWRLSTSLDAVDPDYIGMLIAQPNSAPTHPKNFDGLFPGELRVRDALQLSLNIPVVALSDRLGPNRIYAQPHGFAAATACNSDCQRCATASALAAL